MTARTIPRPDPTTRTPREQPQRDTGRSSLVRSAVRVLTSTDHKVIDNLYFVTTMAFFVVGGLMASCRCRSAHRTWRSRG